MIRAAALGAGPLLALVVSGLPASAADQQIVATPTSTWDPKDVAVNPGESVTWSNPNGGFHNVCVYKPGSTGDTCDEFRNGAAGPNWAGNATNAHTFTTSGAYKFYCEIHGSKTGTGMSGTVTVNGSGTGTTNTETITDTTTVPTQTTPAPDKTAPAFTGKLKRRSSSKSLIIEFGSSERATLEATVFRRAPGKHSFKKVGETSRTVRAGRNTVTVPRQAAAKLRSGAYRVKLNLEDAAGNRSGTRVLTFKIS